MNHIDAVAILREALNTCRHKGNNEVYDAANVGIDALNRMLITERAATQPAGKTAKQQFDELMGDGAEPSALERLRFFCSLAMNGQDWLDAESLFDDLAAPISEDTGKLGTESKRIDHLTECPGCPECEHMLEHYMACDSCGKWGNKEASGWKRADDDQFVCANGCVQTPAAPSSEGDALMPLPFGADNLARLLSNLEDTSYNEGSEALACRLSDCRKVIHELLAARAARTPAGVGRSGDAALGDYYRRCAERLVHDAGADRFVITVTATPRHPLAMGNFDLLVDVRQARERAKSGVE